MNALVKNKARDDTFEVYIGRPSRWGNPFTHKDGTRAEYVVGTRDEAVERYRAWLWAEIRDGRIELSELAALRGKTLGCWCAPARCHGEILAAAAEWAHSVIEAGG